jgi:hypothetical protein
MELNRHFSNEEVQMANKYMNMFNILSHQGNANQNNTEIPSHPSQNGYHKKTVSAGKDVRGRGRNTYSMKVSQITMEISKEGPQKKKKNQCN